MRFLLRLADLTGRRSVRHVLFLCFYNRRRSATAERVFAKRTDLDVRSAGTSRDALLRANEHMLEWADVIFIMDAGGKLLDFNSAATEASWPSAAPGPIWSTDGCPGTGRHAQVHRGRSCRSGSVLNAGPITDAVNLGTIGNFAAVGGP